MTNFTDIRDFLRAHCARYPELALQDVFKALYQSAFGCEHLITDTSAAAEGIRREAAEAGPPTRLPPQTTSAPKRREAVTVSPSSSSCSAATTAACTSAFCRTA